MNDTDTSTTSPPQIAAAPSTGRAWSPEVIDLRGLESLAAPPPPVAGVRVRLDRHVSPLDSMSPQQRKRLYVRVLCELVAYGEADDPAPATEWSPELTSF